jgi:3-hydroxybutyryl-CoA dehydrogenase
MGAGIAQLGAQAGWETLLHDPVADVDAAVAKIVARWEKKGLAHEPPLNAPELTDLAGCDVIVEAIPERLELKQELFAQLGELAPDAVLCSNTSSIPITAIAGAAPDPSKVVGMHFFNPPPVMKLVELTPALTTSEETVAFVVAVAERLGKTVVRAKDHAGFIVNRLLIPFLNDAARLYDEGFATREDIDTAVSLGLGHPMGPLALADLIGIDTCVSVARILFEEFGDARYAPPPVMKRMAAAGHLGRKSGRGFYEY